MYGQNSLSCSIPSANAKAMQPISPAQPPQVPSGIVNEIAEELHCRLMRLRELSGSLEVLADRLLGGVPTGTDSGATQPQAPGQVGNLGGAIPFTDYLLDQLSAHVKRLEQL